MGKKEEMKRENEKEKGTLKPLYFFKKIIDLDRIANK